MINLPVRFQETVRNNIEFIHNLIMGVEAHFHLTGRMNKRNSRFWGNKNYVSQSHPCKVTGLHHTT